MILWHGFPRSNFNIRIHSKLCRFHQDLHLDLDGISSPVVFDSELGMDLHVNNITRSCFYQLRQLRSIRRSLSADAAKNTGPFFIYQVVSTTATAFLRCYKKFCEATSICPQRGCRLISNKRKFDISLRCWGTNSTGFPFTSGSNSRSRSFVRNAVHGRGPTYLSRTCNPVRKVDARAHLRSAVRVDLTVPGTKTRRFGPRSFRVSGPVVWNSLPEDIRIRNCRWNVSNLCWQHVHFAKHMSLIAHSAFVTWLGDAS